VIAACEAIKSDEQAAATTVTLDKHAPEEAGRVIA
jgi:hypothetical protein